MTTIIFRFIFLASLFMTSLIFSQESSEDKISVLNKEIKIIKEQEKEALKEELVAISDRLNKKEITIEQANKLKLEAAKKRALNIENRQDIVSNKIALLERNGNYVLSISDIDSLQNTGLGIKLDITRGDGTPFVWEKRQRKKRELKYDRITYSDFVIAIGLNNSIIDGESINDTPYKVGGSRFFEIGWQWRTRIFKHTNAMRLNYGVSFQFNGLKPKEDKYFSIDNNNETQLVDFGSPLDKSKLRMDNLVFPVHLEFGPSKRNETEEKIRYSLYNKFRIGFGGYFGINLGTRQKLKYNLNGDSVKDKFKRSYNTNDFIYGLSAYVGVGGMQLYCKYDLNPIFKNAQVKQNNISLGLRFDL